MNPLKRILLVEDSARDAELILGALEPHQLAGEVIHVRDGAEALDYLCRGTKTSPPTGARLADMRARGIGTERRFPPPRARPDRSLVPGSR